MFDLSLFKTNILVFYKIGCFISCFKAAFLELKKGRSEMNFFSKTNISTLEFELLSYMEKQERHEWPSLNIEMAPLGELQLCLIQTFSHFFIKQRQTIIT